MATAVNLRRWLKQSLNVVNGRYFEKSCNIESQIHFSVVFSISYTARLLEHAQLRQLLEAYTYVTEMHCTGSGSCPMAGFGFSDEFCYHRYSHVKNVKLLLSNKQHNLQTKQVLMSEQCCTQDVHDLSLFTQATTET
jgi:hypothetical protein